MKDSINVAVAGATGYVGLELVKILSKHPNVNILYVCANKSVGKKIYSFDKKISRKNLPKLTKVENINWNKIKVLFTALPNGEAQKLAKIIPNSVKLIDLSADFRLKDLNLYKKWYGFNHKCKELVFKSIYSITEFSRKYLKNYKIISCPGCYPTSIQIPLLPLVEKKMINTNNIIIDSKSGYSGGGKNVERKFKNLFNSVTAYGVGGHRHMAEIDQELSKVSKKRVKVFFTPHVIPMFRGILSTIYLETHKKIDANKIYKFLKNYHKNNFFIKFAKFNTPISTNEVVNTNFCYISVCTNREKNKVIILSTIDNLIKGASGQAVQNMNVAYNLKETTGLI
ncbi:MAG: N-acetyl-gamma-glutamyl-phosphate reductase [Candidatus Pelagibacterales bacterium]|nr:MAG: N-acetyl-gamma-glutamyl-phosphate reductase [Pelagibacterales bacterium]